MLSFRNLYGREQTIKWENVYYNYLILNMKIRQTLYVLIYFGIVKNVI